jgi:hypothetical protein
MAGRTAGTYWLDVELRRSSGFLGPAEVTVPVVTAYLPGADSATPYQPVSIDFGKVSVSGNETFTVKFIVKSNNFLYLETFGIGNEPCANVIVTSENDVANPTPRSDPAGFKVLP